MNCPSAASCLSSVVLLSCCIAVLAQDSNCPHTRAEQLATPSLFTSIDHCRKNEKLRRDRYTCVSRAQLHGYRLQALSSFSAAGSLVQLTALLGWPQPLDPRLSGIITLLLV
jgi:hypothetical protein